LISVANGTARYVGLPIFTSRSFRHSALYVSADGAVNTPADLAGRRIGLREYTNTASLVARGMLADEYGVDPAGVSWFVGDVDPPFREEVTLPRLVPGMAELSVTPVLGRGLGDMLAEGEIDALIAYNPPAGFRSGGRIRRLFPDFREVEQEYAQRTGLFPIMHLLGVRRDFVGQVDPDVLVDVARGFAVAKAVSAAELLDQQALKVMLPWLTAEVERTRVILGDDYWPFGLARNETVLRTQIRYAREQGLLARDVDLEELFLDWPEIEAVFNAHHLPEGAR